MVLQEPALDQRTRLGQKLDQQPIFLRPFDFALPPVHRGDRAIDLHARRKPLLHQPPSEPGSVFACPNGGPTKHQHHAIVRYRAALGKTAKLPLTEVV